MLEILSKFLTLNKEIYIELIVSFINTNKKQIIENESIYKKYLYLKILLEK